MHWSFKAHAALLAGMAVVCLTVAARELTGVLRWVPEGGDWLLGAVLLWLPLLLVAVARDCLARLSSPGPAFPYLPFTVQAFLVLSFLAGATLGWVGPEGAAAGDRRLFACAGMLCVLGAGLVLVAGERRRRSPRAVEQTDDS
ncbi:hypothetical protein ACIBI4_30670 [Streptomyces sp. NPDC050418]|uniref:hypothetical protein n=1 Tax=Streptomyces sp. NPDC050418 TaxID=3365612 RepID=UPI003799FA37